MAVIQDIREVVSTPFKPEVLYRGREVSVASNPAPLRPIKTCSADACLWEAP